MARRPRAASIAPVTWRDGVHLTGTPIWCDARRRRDICFVSSADRVGRTGHGQLIGSPTTLALLSAKGDGHLAVPLRQRFTLGTLRLELIPSGRGLGAAALHVDAVGRTQEIQRLIGRSLRAVTDLKALGERTIHLDCDVIQADGGTRCAAITGAYVALRDACDGLFKASKLATWPLRGAVAATSVGMVNGQALLDLDYAEDSGCDTDMNLVMTQAGTIIELQGTAEGAPFSRAELDALLNLGQAGIASLIELQGKA